MSAPDAPVNFVDGGFVVLPNEVFGLGLSLRAVGLLSLMISKPPGWRFAAQRIAAQVSEGRDAIQTAMRELRDAGYVVLRKRGAPNPGSEYFLRRQLSTPWPWDRTGFPGAVNPGAVNPGAEEPGASVKKEVVNTHSVNKEGDVRSVAKRDDSAPSSAGQPAADPLAAEQGTLLTPPSTPAPSPPPDRFDEFWQLYPRKEAKAAARKAWKAKTVKSDDNRHPVDAQVIIDALVQRIAWWKRDRTPSTLVLYPASWLNGERWLDELVPVEAKAVSMTQRQLDRDERKRDEVEAALERGDVDAAWKMMCERGGPRFRDIDSKLTAGWDPALIAAGGVSETDVEQVVQARAAIARVGLSQAVPRSTPRQLEA